jgi:hypothetical protein
MMASSYQDFQNEKKIIQVLANYKDIKSEIKQHNKNVLNIFENQIKNEMWQAQLRGKKQISQNDYYRVVKEFWKKYYVYEV